MSDHYDVIIIGTGAGGGTLAHRLAPSGKRILLLERGGYLRASPRTGTRARSSARSATSPARSGTTRTATPFQPARSSTSSAATPSSTARSCSACASATSARCATTAASRPRGRSSYDDLEPYYAEAERLYLVHGQARRGPDRAAALGPVPVPGRVATSRASSSCTTTSRAPASTRSTCRSASTSTSPTPRRAAACAATASTASPA